MSPRLTKYESRKRWSELQTLLNEWDFIGVMDHPDSPRDEYDCLIGPLLSRLEAGESAEALASFLNKNLREHFGVDEGKDAVDFARRIRNWFDSHCLGTSA